MLGYQDICEARGTTVQVHEQTVDQASKAAWL
jgi:hypothetical protein